MLFDFFSEIVPVLFDADLQAPIEKYINISNLLQCRLSRPYVWHFAIILPVVVFGGVYTIQQTSSKLPANVYRMHVLINTGRLLDRVNTLFYTPQPWHDRHRS